MRVRGCLCIRAEWSLFLFVFLLLIAESTAGTVQSSLKSDPPMPVVTDSAPPGEHASRTVAAAIDSTLSKASGNAPNFVNVNAPTVNPAINMQVNPNMTFTFDFKNYSLNTIFQYTSKIKGIAKGTVDGVVTSITDHFLATYARLIEHKKTVCFVCVFAVYCAIQWRIHRLERLLKLRKNWSLYTACIRDAPFEDIYEDYEDHEYQCCCIDVDIDQLIVAVQRRYIDKENVFDCMRPLAVFMDAVDQEFEILKQYCDIIKQLRKLYLSKLFWYSAELFESVPSRLARLIAIKSSFISWLADCKQEALHTMFKREQRMNVGIRFILRS